MATDLHSVRFPQISAGGVPEDRDAIRAIVAGQGALVRLYEELEAACNADARFVVGLLRRDWQAHLSDLLPAGADLIRSLDGVGSAPPGILPAPDAISALTGEHATGDAKRAVEFLRAFAERALCCTAMIPWKSDNERVFEHFRASLEAEDAHLGTLDLLSTLIGATT